MGYYNKFNPSDKSNFYTPVDGCGGTYEDKYYVNGMYVDLCGLSIEEYMKNPCCCGGSGNNEDVEPVKPTNEILVKSFKDENGTIFYQAFAKFAVTSTIKIVVSATQDVVTELDLFVGDTTSRAEIGETLNFLSATLNVNEDENYRYIIVSETEKLMYEVYYNTVLLSNIDVIGNSLEQITIAEDTTKDISFIIPATSFNYNELEDMDEIERFFNENQYCFLMYLPKNIYKNGNYVVTSYDGMDITKKFTYHKDIVINNEDYVCVVEKANDDVAAYVPQYNEDIKFDYKLTINI